MLPGSIFIFLLQILFSFASPKDGISVSVDSHITKIHSKFVPMVAFLCGYRNKYTNDNGGWTTDKNKFATCLTGKLDILKYCRKVYPNLNITNIVEYSHEEKIDRWCDEDATTCKYSHTVRPYRCIDGEFVAQALQVPNGCTFGHISSRSMCNDYSQLNNKAFAECSKMNDSGRPMVLRSFSVLQPCAIDLFRGVEYVCCPSIKKTKTNEILTNDINEITEGNEFEEDEEFDTDDLINTIESDDNDTLIEKSEQDPYFKEITNANNEHEKYREAEKRLEQRHRSEVSKIINVWSELYDKYKTMKESNINEAEKYKKEMVGKFRKTVANIEEENKEIKKQIETVHEERLKNIFNERKRKATHEFREALARHVEKDNKAEIVRTLKACIRSEEKDRYHMLNRYRHLLRTDGNEAEKYRSELLHNLKYIDLRINGTIAMLDDFSELAEAVGPIVKTFWREYRKEHTPELDTNFLINGMEENDNIKLVNLYKTHYEKLHEAEKNMRKKYFLKTNIRRVSTTSTTTSTTTTTTTLSPTTNAIKKDIMNELEKTDLDSVENNKSKEVKVIEYVKFNKSKTDDESGYDEDEDEDDYDDDDDDDDNDTSDEEDKKNKKKDSLTDSSDSDEDNVPVEIEPIISGPIMDSFIDESPSYVRLSKMDHNRHLYNHSKSQSYLSSNFIIYGFIGTLCSVFLVAAITLYSRNRHSGFVEVDVCTPEERHVNNMQVNGYENPTYTYYDASVIVKPSNEETTKQ